MQYLAAKVFVTSPTTPAHVMEAFEKMEVYKNFGLTLHEGRDQTPFFKVCHDEKDFSYCVFSSDKMIGLTKENIPLNINRRILIDGTFSIVPIGCFQQLLLVHIEYYEKVGNRLPRKEGGRGCDVVRLAPGSVTARASVRDAARRTPRRTAVRLSSYS